MIDLVINAEKVQCNLPDSNRLLLTSEACRRTVDLLATMANEELQRAYDGRVHFTLLGRCMPIEWLSSEKHLLPVVLAAGALVLKEQAPKLTRDDLTITGYRLADEIYYSEALCSVCIKYR